MEYDEEDIFLGDVPECGAIFMSNTLTMKEYFKRQIFALPSSRARFVKHIKAGMLLFLFDIKKRQLFGVFEATSDGGMDIVPDGLYSSGRHLPAQVCFQTLWHCHPLYEKEFRNAITENYFSAKIFKFGLTEVQVSKLLNLFSSRKIKKNFPPCLPREDGDRAFISNDSSELRERAFIEYDDHNPSALSEYQVGSMIRAKEEALMEDDVLNGEGKIYHTSQDLLSNYHDVFWSKRRRKDCDAGFLMNDETENEKYDPRIMLRPFRSDSSDDPLEVRKLVNVEFSPSIDSGHGENHVIMGKYTVDPLDARTHYGRLMHRNRLFSDSYMDDGLDQPYAKRLSKNYHAIDDNMVLHDNFSGEYVTLDHFKPMAPTGQSGHNSKLLTQAMHRPDDHMLSMNENFESGYQVRYDNDPVNVSEEFHNHLHRTRTAVSGIFPHSTDMEDAYTSVNGQSSESFLHQLDCESRVLYGRKIHTAKGRVAGNTVDSTLCSTTCSGHITTGRREDFDHKRFRSSNRLKNDEGGHAFVSPAMSKYSPYSQPKTRSSSLSFHQDHNSSSSAFDEATISRAARYIPEIPDGAHGWSASAAIDWKSSFEQETHIYHGSTGNSYSLSNSSASPLLSQKSSRSISVDLEGGIRTSQANASTHHSPLLCRTTNSPLHSNLSVHRAPKINTPVNCGDTTPSLFSLPSLPPARSNVHGGKGLAVAYPCKSSERPFVSNHHHQVAALEYVPKHDPIIHMDEDVPNSASHSVRDLLSYGNHYIRTSDNDNSKEHQRVSEVPQSDPSNIRRSVFDRLEVGEDSNKAHFNSDHQCLDASADEVMERLQPGKNLPPCKLKDSKVVESKHVNNDLHNNQIQRRIDLGHSTVEEKDLEDLYVETAECTGKALKETRIVGFMRRSEKKKSLVDTRTYAEASNNNAIPGDKVESPTKNLKREDEIGSATNVLKRRRLVRPDFHKMEPALKHTSKAAIRHLKLPHASVDKPTSEKTICISNGELLNVNVCSSNVLPSLSHESPNGKKNDPCCSQKEMDLQCHVFPSLRDDTEKGHRSPSMKDIQTGTLQVLHDETSQETCGVQNTTGLLSKEPDPTMKSLKQQEQSLEIPKLDSSTDTCRQSSMEDIQTGTLQVLHDEATQETFGVQNTIDLLSKEADPAMKSLKQQEHSVEIPKLDSSTDACRQSSMEDIQPGTLQVLHDEATLETCGVQNTIGLLSKEADPTMKSLKQQEPSLEIPKLDSSTNTCRQSSMEDIQTGTLQVLHGEATQETSGVQNTIGLLSKEADPTMKSFKQQEHSLEIPKLDSSTDACRHSSMEDIQPGTWQVLHDEATLETCGVQKTIGLLSKEADPTMKSLKQQDHSLEIPKLDSSTDGCRQSSMEDIQPGTSQVLHDEATRETCGMQNTMGLLSKEADPTMKSLKQQEHFLGIPKLDSRTDTPRDGRKLKTVVKRVKKLVRFQKSVQENGQDLEKDKDICETTLGRAEVCSVKDCLRKGDQEDRKAKNGMKSGKVVQGQDQDPEKEKESCETLHGRSGIVVS